MLSVKRFFVFFTPAKGSFTLLYSMLTGRATHQAVFVNSGFDLSFLFASAFHCYNILHLSVIVKHC